ncbi:hypothetical protein OG609_43450 [Streptomyces sp. NBC_01224]|uniref:hypothetical protein n=1 Tax=unclassified Streptomyces TaxID=2593676 RepID=UPI002E0DA428|nr:hypothetical protein OG609_43450 [Streptomyces sp. NBC_01224]
MSIVMQATPHGSDLQEKPDQSGVTSGGSSGRTFFSGARRAGSGSGRRASVIALRQYLAPPTRDGPDDTNKHPEHQVTRTTNEHRPTSAPGTRRALRKRPGEGKVARLVVPVCLAPSESPDEMLASKAYDGLTGLTLDT